MNQTARNINDKQTLIPTKELILIAKKAGVKFGHGNPLNRLRYFTKTGLLPHAQRKQTGSHDFTEGHYPAYAVDLLLSIQQLKKAAKPPLEIAKIIASQRLKYEIVEKAQNLGEAFTFPKTPSTFNFSLLTFHFKLRRSLSYASAVIASLAFLALVLAFTANGQTYLTQIKTWFAGKILTSTPPGKVAGIESDSSLRSSGQALFLPTSQNLLANSSFENPSGLVATDGQGKTKFGQAWRWGYIEMGHGGNFYVSTESIRSGTLAMKVWDSGTESAECKMQNAKCKMNVGITQQETTAINGRNYALSVFLRSKNLAGNPKLRLGFKGEKEKYRDFNLRNGHPELVSGSDQMLNQVQHDDSLDWTPFSFSYENAALGEYPFIEIVDYQGGTIYFDDASMIEVGSEKWEAGNGSLTSNYLTSVSNFSPLTSHLLLADGSIKTDAGAGLYPADDSMGSLGMKNKRFATIYLNDADFKNSLTVGGPVEFLNNLKVAGAATISGNLTIQNSKINFDSAQFNSDITPSENNKYNLGQNTTPLRWQSGFFQTSLLVNDGSKNITITPNDINFSANSTLTMGGSLKIGADAIYVSGTSGNVGIGTTSPLSKLGILGNLSVGATYGNFAAPTSGAIFEGNVGIGTTNPGAKLDVNGTLTVTGSNLTTLGGNLTVTGTAWTATPTISGLITATSGLTSNNTLTVQNNSNFTQTGSGTFGTGTGAVSLNGETTIASGKNLTLTSGNLLLSSGLLTQTGAGNNSFAGNLGIGTTAPSAKLDIIGNLSVSSYATVSASLGIGTSAAAGPGNLNIQGNAVLGTSTAQTLTVNGYVISDLIPKTESGNFNLGSNTRRWDNVWANTVTASNISGTVVTGSTSAFDWMIGAGQTTADTQDITITFERGTPATNAELRWDSTNKWLSTNVSTFNIKPDAGITLSGKAALIVDQIQSQDILTASASAVTKLVLSNAGNLGLAGNLGIGTTSPSQNLDLAQASGIMTFSNSTGVKQILTGGTTNLALMPGGNVGIGTTAPAAKLHVAGQCVTGDTLLKRRRRRKGKNGEWIEDWEDVRIDQIQEGDEILTLNEQTGEFVKSKVNKLMNMGIKTTFRLVTQDGKEIRTTDNHPYLTRLAPNPNSNFLHDLTFQTVKHFAREFYFKVLLGQKVKVTALGGAEVHFTDEGFEHLEDPRRSQINVLSRYFALPKVTEVLEKSQKVYRYEKRAVDGRETEYWEFREEIDGVDVKVIVRSLDGKPKHYYSVVWRGKKEKVGDVASRSAYERRGRMITPQRQAYQNLYTTFIKELSRAGIAGPKQLAKIFEQKWVKVRFLTLGMEIAVMDAEGKLEWQKIKSIEKVGQEQVFDIEVENTHNFVGNGIVAHNTSIFGAGEGGTPTTTTLRGAAGAGTNIAGANFTFDASNGTGTGGSGALIFRTAPTGTTGTTANTLAEIMRITPGGNVGIGTTAPTQLLAVGSSSQFNVSSLGAVVAVGVNSGSGLLQGTGGLTVTGTGNLNATGTSATNIGNSTGVLTLASGGASSWTNTSGDLTIKTATSGNVLLSSIGNVGIGSTAPTAAPFLFVGSTGNVGIGTTSPAYKLEVNGTLGVGSTATFSSLVNITGLNASQAVYTDASKNLTSAIPTTGSLGFWQRNSTNLSPATLTDYIGIGTTSPIGPLQVNNGATPAFVITSAGNLGIGTTSPTALLHLGIGSTAVIGQKIVLASGATANAFEVNTSTGVGGNLVVMQSSGNVGIGTTSPASVLSVNGGISAGTYSGTAAPSGGMIISGNVGIGTTGPGTKLELKDGTLSLTDADVSHPMTVFGATNAYGFLQPYSGTIGGLDIVGLTDADQAIPVLIRGYHGVADPTDSYAAVQIRTGKSNGGTSIADLGASETAFQISDATATDHFVTILGSGNVGIGTTSPASVLSVNGGISAGTYSGTAAPSGGMIISGNVGIGTTGPQRALEVNGSIRMGALITGAGTAVAVYRDVNGDLADSTSSLRYKDSLTPLENVLPKLMDLEAVRFNWGQNTSTPGLADFGMIAEQVNTVLPDLVTYEADGVTPHGLKYEKMGLFALKGLQELASSASRQQLQIAASNAAIASLSAELATKKSPYGDFLGASSSETSTSLIGSSELIRGTSLSSFPSLTQLVSFVNSQNSQLLLWSGPEGNRAPGTWLDKLAPNQSGPTQLLLSDILVGLVNNEATQSGILKQVQDDMLKLDQTSNLVTQKFISDFEFRISSLEAKYAASNAAIATLSAQLATASATLSNLSDLGNLGDATISGILTVLGKTTLADLGVTGNLTAGLLTIDGLNSACLEPGSSLGSNDPGSSCLSGASLSTLSGPLRLQDSALGNLEIMAGKIVIDTKGNLIVEGTITAKNVETENLKVLGASSAGSATLPLGQTEIEISADSASDSARILLTPTSLTDKILTVVKKGTGKFVVAIAASASADLKFDWFIVGN